MSSCAHFAPTTSFLFIKCRCDCHMGRALTRESAWQALVMTASHTFRRAGTETRAFLPAREGHHQT